MKRYHLMTLWGASTGIAMCGRKLANPWTVDEPGMYRNVCKACERTCYKNGKSISKCSPIEDREVKS